MTVPTFPEFRRKMFLVMYANIFGLRRFFMLEYWRLVLKMPPGEQKRLYREFGKWRGSLSASHLFRHAHEFRARRTIHNQQYAEIHKALLDEITKK